MLIQSSYVNNMCNRVYKNKKLIIYYYLLKTKVDFIDIPFTVLYFRSSMALQHTVLCIHT